MSEGTKACVVIVVIALLVSAVIAFGLHEYYITQREALKAGMIEKPNPGSGFHWEKP